MLHQPFKISFLCAESSTTAQKARPDRALCGAPPPQHSWGRNAVRYFMLGRHGKVQDFCARWSNKEAVTSGWTESVTQTRVCRFLFEFGSIIKIQLCLLIIMGLSLNQFQLTKMNIQFVVQSKLFLLFWENERCKHSQFDWPSFIFYRNWHHMEEKVQMRAQSWHGRRNNITWGGRAWEGESLNGMKSSAVIKCSGQREEDGSAPALVRAGWSAPLINMWLRNRFKQYIHSFICDFSFWKTVKIYPATLW